jgi:hypothetical protein
MLDGVDGFSLIRTEEKRRPLVSMKEGRSDSFFHPASEA